MDKPPPPPKNRRRGAAVSLSPQKTRKALNPSMVVPVHARTSKARKASQHNFGVALSKAETVLVTGTGDVLVCRCRYSSKAYKAAKQANGGTEQNDDPHSDFWWESSECRSICNPCAGSGSSPRMSIRKDGLLGGAPPQLDVQVEPGPENKETELTNNSADTPEKDEDEDAPTSPETQEKDEDARVVPASTPSDALQTQADNGDNGIDDLEVLPSFDYSHFAGEGNDMAPAPSNEMPHISEERQEQRLEEKRKVKPEPRVTPPLLMHGVPTFLPSFHQVKVTQVSANPLGSHVLLISAEALLFSFGLNNHGQLGHGYKSPEKGELMGFVTKPSIVTPLLENGGKAVVCAAGVDYSLVVVKTEGRRIGRLHQQTRHRSAPLRRGSSDSNIAVHMTKRVASLPPRIQPEADDDLEMQSSDDSVESMCHHQLYGFGRNDGRKLGLVDPSKRKKAEDVLLPRRVALNCNVWPGTEESNKDLPPPGIFAVAASAHHSAALVRRASGAIELYTWGDATFNALGPVEGGDPKPGMKTNRRLNGGFTPLPIAVTVPTVVKQLSYSASDQSTNGQGIIPAQVALGPTSTFVITSAGKVLSFGKSDTGLLGQGHGVVVTEKPGQIVFPSVGSRVETKISSISVGPSHAVAVASSGRVYAWGKNEGGVMGFDSALRKHLSRGARRGPGGERRSSQHDEVEWIPREVELPASTQPVVVKKWIRKSKDSETAKDSIGPPPLSGDKVNDRVVQACAGYDMTVFVTETGAVLSCGASSGRLGLGETGTTAVITPTPMFGGLHLWR